MREVDSGMPKSSNSWGSSGPNFAVARKEAFARTNGHCAFCGYRPAVHAHHWSPIGLYPKDSDTTANHLTPLCKECHYLAGSIRSKLNKLDSYIPPGDSPPVNEASLALMDAAVALKAVAENMAVTLNQPMAVQRPKTAPAPLPLPRTLLKRKEVTAITGLTTSSIYQKMKKGEFPNARQIGPGSVAWRYEDIMAWIESLPESKPGVSQ